MPPPAQYRPGRMLPFAPLPAATANIGVEQFICSQCYDVYVYFWIELTLLNRCFNVTDKAFVV